MAVTAGFPFQQVHKQWIPKANVKSYVTANSSVRLGAELLMVHDFPKRPCQPETLKGMTAFTIEGWRKRQNGD